MKLFSYITPPPPHFTINAFFCSMEITFGKISGRFFLLWIKILLLYYHPWCNLKWPCKRNDCSWWGQISSISISLCQCIKNLECKRGGLWWEWPYMREASVPVFTNWKQLLAIVSSVIFWFIASNYPLGVFTLFLKSSSTYLRLFPWFFISFHFYC